MQGKRLWEYAETTCDGKNKMHELMGKIKPMHIMNLPQTMFQERMVIDAEITGKF